MLERLPKWLPHLHVIHEADGLTPLRISGSLDAEKLCSLSKVSQPGKESWHLNLGLPASPSLFFIQVPIYYKKSARWQRREHLNAILTPSLLYVFFQSFFISKGFFSFFFKGST